MARTRPAPGGGRWVEVDPQRLPGWLEGFQQRHGSVAVTAADHVLLVRAFDGAVAELHPVPGGRGGADLAEFVADAQAPRRPRGTLSLIVRRSDLPPAQVRSRQLTVTRGAI